ncbi:MAG: DUF2442 domain-containing protein [bacterium]|nr:DUF2442 domain-containing protein [bacterium]MCW5891043.1 DUF2442 domain-containing protein [bacterium]
MSTSRVEQPSAVAVRIGEDELAIDLSDGRSVTVPLAWYPRLVSGTVRERRHWRLIGSGEGVHWPDLDEDISVEGVLAGRPSAESQGSFERWLASRKRANKRRQPARSSPGKSGVRRRARG